MTDIVEFLRARYAEDEVIARAAGNGDDLSWAGWQLDGQLEEAGWDYPETVNREAHVLRHDPARVLADIDAKLKIVGLYTYVRYNDDDEPYFCGSGEETWYETTQLEWAASSPCTSDTWRSDRSCMSAS